jgi:hypothetical protein
VLVWLLLLPHAVVQEREVALTALLVPWLAPLAVSHVVMLAVESLFRQPQLFPWAVAFWGYYPALSSVLCLLVFLLAS